MKKRRHCFVFLERVSRGDFDVILHDFMSIFCCCVFVVFVLSHRNFSMYVCENDDDELRQNKTSGIYINIISTERERERERSSTHTLFSAADSGKIRKTVWRNDR